MKTPSYLLVVIAMFTAGCMTESQIRSLPDERLFYLGSPYIAQQDLYRKEIVRRHPEWPDPVKQNVLDGKISLGMTAAQTQAAWGVPEKVNRTVTNAGVSEQWIYCGFDSHCINSSYAYIENGVLTGWQV